jgi:hypothetical protein
MKYKKRYTYPLPAKGKNRRIQDVENMIVACEVTGRWLQIEQKSTLFGPEREFTTINIMTESWEDTDVEGPKKLCSLIVIKKDLIAALNKTMPEGYVMSSFKNYLKVNENEFYEFSADLIDMLFFDMFGLFPTSRLLFKNDEEINQTKKVWMDKCEEYGLLDPVGGQSIFINGLEALPDLDIETMPSFSQFRKLCINNAPENTKCDPSKNAKEF